LLHSFLQRLTNLIIGLPLKMLQEFRRFDDNRNCKILGSVILQPISLVPEIGDAVPERRNGCLLIHEKHRSSLVPIRILSVGNLITRDRKSTRLNSSHVAISYAVF